MKDFNEVLQANSKSKRQIREQFFAKHLNNPFTQTQRLQQNEDQMTFHRKYQYQIGKLIKYSSPFLLSVITGPFTTLSILLQVTQKPIINPRLITQQSIGSQLMVKLAKINMLGDSPNFLAQKVNGYNDGFKKLGKQGIRGMYKGNLTGVLSMTLNTNLRNQLYGFIKDPHFQSTYSQTSKAVATILLCTAADWLILPLMMAQSRLVLQNSAPNFRTYTHFYDVLRKVPVRYWFAGSSLLVGKNIVTNLSWLNFFKQSKVNSFIFSTFLAHVVTYPFMTVIRNLQTNSIPIKPMMNNNKQGVYDCIKRINNAQGVRGFYKGFGPYAVVHSLLGMIMVQQNINSGYFQMIE